MIPYQKPVVFCSWADDTHTIYSHCADPEIASDPETVHCVNSERARG